MTSSPTLSICIPTLNRARFIGETLESITRQLDDRVEVVIVDGGSTDATGDIVRSYASRFPSIRYVVSQLGDGVPSNQGFDRDCDQAVTMARGTYCWLMTDDDLLADGAIRDVMARLDEGHDLLFACARVCNVDLSQTLVPALPAVPADKAYDRDHWAEFFEDVGHQLTFVGGIIIKRQIWQSRPRQPYFGTGFVHVGVILSAPMDSVLVISRPLVVIRYGNAQWRSRAFDIWMNHWPTLVWSFASLPDSAKAAVTPRFPFNSVRRLFWYRALGAYTMDKYHEWLMHKAARGYRIPAWLIARMPVAITNALCSLYLAPRMTRPFSMQLYDLLHCGHASALTRGVAHLRGIR
jgi:abequosyltransferase